MVVGVGVKVRIRATGLRNAVSCLRSPRGEGEGEGVEAG
jgi:hypothetical protein